MWTYNYNDAYFVGNELYHHGVPGMRWGHRKTPYERLGNKRARLLSKQNLYSQRAQKYRVLLAKPNSMKRQAKAAKFQRKLDKAEIKATKARKRLAQGKDISARQQKRIIKAEKLKGKVAKYSAKDSKFKSKLSKNEYKISKIQKRIDRIDKKLTVAQARVFDKYHGRIVKRYEKFHDLDDRVNSIMKSDPKKYASLNVKRNKKADKMVKANAKDELRMRKQLASIRKSQKRK